MTRLTSATRQRFCLPRRRARASLHTSTVDVGEGVQTPELKGRAARLRQERAARLSPFVVSRLAGCLHRAIFRLGVGRRVLDDVVCRSPLDGLRPLVLSVPRAYEYVGLLE